MSDPYFSDVALLIHFDGSITDASANALTVSNSDVSVSTTAPKFGSGCGSFSGASQLTIASAVGSPLDLSTTDFTIEFWAKPAAGGNLFIYDDSNNSTTGFRLTLVNEYYWIFQGYGSAAVTTYAAGPFTDGNWHHCAMVRSGNNLLPFVDGVMGSPISFSGSLSVSPTTTIGSSYVGELDELRISRIARYTVNFTPPTVPFYDETPVAVPNVTGLTVAAAEAALTNAGFVVGSISSLTNATTAAGSIASQSLSGPQVPGLTVNLVESIGYGNEADISNRMNLLLPVGWFSGLTPVKDALVAGVASVFAFIYSLFAYVRLQTRIATATDGFLDLIAGDFFGDNLPRNPGESDASYQPRIKTNLFLEKGTRADVIRVVTQLTGNVPLIVEPSRPADCGAYGIAMGYSTGGRLGSIVHPYQAFLTVARGTSASDASLYAAIDAVKPIGTIIWVKLL